MTKLELTVAIAASVAVLAVGTTSRADDTASSTTSTSVAQPQPVQSQPVQSVTVQQPPVSTTTTTASPFVPSERAYEQTTQKLPNRALLSTGTSIFVVSYVPSLVVAVVSDRDEDKRLFIPVVGPWIDLGQRDCNARPCGSREDINKAMIITSGIAQGAGVLLGLSSLFIPETVTTKGTERSAKPEVHVVPVSYADGAGIGAIGRF